VSRRHDDRESDESELWVAYLPIELERHPPVRHIRGGRRLSERAHTDEHEKEQRSDHSSHGRKWEVGASVRAREGE